MSLLGGLHQQFVHSRRVRALAREFARVLPANARVLDVGCGDGRLDAALLEQRRDLHLEGCEFLVRPGALIEVRPFDGQHLPYPDGSFDVVMFVDVLHHTLEPETLLREAARVARQYVAIKDHTADSRTAHKILSLMDWVGNARHNVPLPYNYQSTRQWSEIWQNCGLNEAERQTRLRIYPWYADWLFGANLHFLSLLRAPEFKGAHGR